MRRKFEKVSSIERERESRVMHEFGVKTPETAVSMSLIVCTGINDIITPYK